MSKKSKANAKFKRLKVKRARKAARQAMYETYTKLGQNKKSKRYRKGQQSGLVKSNKHVVSYCGNLACKQCFPAINNPMLAPRHSCLWMKQFTSRRFNNE